MSKACLLDKPCIPCSGNVPPVDPKQFDELMGQLDSDWCLVDGHHLERKYSFADFREALAFTNRVGEIAEQEGHHPEIHLSWGWVRLLIWTHKIDGLTESDFILAAKADAAL